VALSGFDGLIWAIGGLVGWPIVLFLIAEPLRNLGQYTFADVVVVPVDFFRLPLIAVVGALFYAEPFDPAVFIGAGLIVAGVWFNLASETRRVRA